MVDPRVFTLARAHGPLSFNLAIDFEMVSKIMNSLVMVKESFRLCNSTINIESRWVSKLKRESMYCVNADLKVTVGGRPPSVVV